MVTDLWLECLHHAICHHKWNLQLTQVHNPEIIKRRIKKKIKTFTFLASNTQWLYHHHPPGSTSEGQPSVAPWHSEIEEKQWAFYLLLKRNHLPRFSCLGCYFQWHSFTSHLGKQDYTALTSTTIYFLLYSSTIQNYCEAYFWRFESDLMMKSVKENLIYVLHLIFKKKWGPQRFKSSYFVTLWNTSQHLKVFRTFSAKGTKKQLFVVP